MKRKDFNSYREYLHAVLDHRSTVLRDRLEMHLATTRKSIDYLDESLDKTWLEQFVVGRGLDIACGDFPIVGARGVDIRYAATGYDRLCEGDNLVFQDSNSLDFIVTNWFEVFPDPLKALGEWYRCLKEGGVLALVCRDVLLYDSPKGPLESRHRSNVYCKKTLSMYLYKVGFKEVIVEEYPETKALRAKAIK